MSQPASLDRDELLKSVSRSFYLSMRFLPPTMRDSIAVGYLAARLSDTVADAPGLKQTRRLYWLGELEKVASGARGSLGEMGEELSPCLEHAGERALVEAAGQLPEWLAALPSALRASVHQVLATISGKMRKRFIRLTAGDRVKMEMSPYDLNKARITYRLG